MVDRTPREELAAACDSIEDAETIVKGDRTECKMNTGNISINEANNQGRMIRINRDANIKGDGDIEAQGVISNPTTASKNLSTNEICVRGEEGQVACLTPEGDN